MDTKFSTAIHALILIAASPAPITSEKVARSVGTNASYIRKIAGMLKKQGMIESHRGIGGFSLKGSAEQITLLDIYKAVEEKRSQSVFDLHKNANGQCAVGRYIEPMLSDMFGQLRESFAKALQEKTLADCMLRIRRQMEAEQQEQPERAQAGWMESLWEKLLRRETDTAHG